MNMVSYQLTYTPTISSVNLHLLRHQLQNVIHYFSEAFSSISIINLRNGQAIDKKIQHALMNIILNEEKLIIDKILMPLIIEIKKPNSGLASTFYENRFGFTEADLLDAEFCNFPVKSSIGSRQTSALFSNRLNLFNKQSFVLNNLHTSRRGFKTKRTYTKESEQSSLRGLVKSKVDEVKDASFLSSLLQGPKMAEFVKKSSQDIYKNKVTPNDELSKIKIAFAEGYLAHDKSIANKSQYGSKFNRAFRLFLTTVFILILVLSIFPSLSDSASKQTGGPGIKFRVPLPGSTVAEVKPEDISVKFSDVRGVQEAKEELKDIVDYLKDPVKFTRLGARLPKGVLLVGSPGVGKTLLAKAVAGEAGVAFFHASGSEFDEMFVGTGARKMRQLFQAARARSPCVIFIDEIDSVGAKRTTSPVHPYANQTINQMLAEMDGFQKNEGIIVLAATNRPEHLDKALTRPGRFDVQVTVEPPDYKGRIDILEFYLNKIIQGTDIDVKKIAKKTVGFTGAELENLVNQAALKAALDNDNEVNMKHIEWGYEKVTMGPAKLSKIPDEETNRVTAYHEAGHTLVAYYTKDAMPLSKVTIIPRGRALGYTAMTPTEKDQYGRTKSQLLASIDVSLGGRIAEEMMFGGENVTTGASNDFQSANSIAENMVKIYGMSDKLGFSVVRLSVDRESNNLSPQTQEIIDQEIRRLLQESHDRAKNILKTHSSELKALAEALLQYETLDVDEIKAVIEGKKLPLKSKLDSGNTKKKEVAKTTSKKVTEVPV